MKGVILAGGMGTRLMPLTKVTNKHLLPVGMKPMVMHPLGKLVEAGVTDVMLVTGPEHAGEFVRLLGSGREHGCELTYRMQDEAGGIAQALSLCEEFVGDDTVCVVLGDNIFTFPLGGRVDSFETSGEQARIVVMEVDDPSRFGVLEIDPEDQRPLSIEEKPARPKSSLAVLGIYFYRPSVFEVIRGLEPSARGELEISDVNQHFLSEGELMVALVTSGRWTDAGTPESYALANEIVRTK
jgi:glucose-1-phosphate thymidylyltransferase